MDVFNMLIGMSLILVSIIIFITQMREGVYSKKRVSFIGDVKLTVSGLFSLLGSIYFLIIAF